MHGRAVGLQTKGLGLRVGLGGGLRTSGFGVRRFWYELGLSGVETV